MRETLKLGFILFAVCLVSALCLSITYGVTQARIEARTDIENALKEVMPDSGGGFEKVTKDDFTYYKAYSGEGKKNVSGYVVIAEGKGYGGPVMTMAGVDRNGIIKGIKILEHKETPGLGTKIVRESFLSQFPGQDGLGFEMSRSSGGKDKIMAISGATISSRAVIDSVKSYIKRLFEIEKIGL